jgi:hypothetical protein
MLYPKNQKPELEGQLFVNPASEYRATPFWAWNGDLQIQPLLEQIDIFKKMGMGGFHMHARAGLKTPYLNRHFMSCVEACCEKAEKEGLLAWLYDEDRYPSGPAGGIVTRNPAFTRRYMRVTPFAYGEEGETETPFRGFPRLHGTLVSRYDVELDAGSCLKSYRRLKDGESASGRLWYAYFEVQPPTTDISQTYVDTLNPRAIQEFARVTYDVYKDHVGKYFGGVVPAIFTDEPQYATETTLSFAGGLQDIILPWTDDFAETFSLACGSDILDALPEIIWNLPEGFSRSRFLYHDHVAERYVGAFCDTLGAWCEKNNIMFTGHIMSEGSLSGQTMRSGEAMRAYRSFQLPGIDVLGLHKLEYTTAKQAQSSARQQGAPGVLSELYGVSGWDFDFRGFKLQGDWQAATGVTVRVPHHSWYTMSGRAKRYYPGSIGYQAPWWEEYKLLEDHFARLNTALTRGKPVVRVGVIHPIESLWVNYGPTDQSGAVIDRIEDNFSGLINTLIEGLIDFDFISEARFPQLCPAGSNPLRVGKMSYDAVVVPGLHTIRPGTLERLAAFKAGGGRLIFMGGCPEYVDAKKSGEAAELYNSSETISFDGTALVEKLQSLRFVEITLPNGSRAKHIIHTERDDGNGKWLFFATTRGQPSPDVDIPNQAIKFNVGQKFETEILGFTIHGEYALEEYDTITGRIRPLPAGYRDGKTIFSRRWHMHDSLLLKLSPGRNQGNVAPAVSFPAEAGRIFGKVMVSLDEPNVLLLDMAEYSLDNGPMRPLEDILKIENICRAECGLPLRRFFNPSDNSRGTEKHSVTLRFRIQSEIKVEGSAIALEEPAGTRILFNGKEISSSADGWYTDKSIQTVRLPPLNTGENIIELCLPMDDAMPFEYCYLLGDFGVTVAGTDKKIIAPVRELAFGSWVYQGLPFYGSNVTYHIKAETKGGICLRVPHYRGALMRVWVDGIDRGTIAFSPYSLELPDLTPGEHEFDIKLYGTRQNCFGPLHHLGSIPFSQGPDSWRSDRDLWNYEYHLSDKGIMGSPRIYRL